MAIPVLILGAIASAVIGKVVSKVLEDPSEQKACKPDLFQQLVNKFSDDKGTAGADGVAAGATEKKVTSKDDKSDAANRASGASSLAAMLESQRLQSQTAALPIAVAENKQVCEVPSVRATYTGTEMPLAGSTGVSDVIVIPGNGNLAVNGLETSTLQNTNLQNAVTAPSQAAQAAKKAAQFKTVYGTSTAPAAVGQPFKIAS